jgi:hypothetical protein
MFASATAASCIDNFLETVLLKEKEEPINAVQAHTLAQSWVSASCPKKVKASLFLGPPASTDGHDSVDPSMRLFVRVEGSEGLQLVAHCSQATKLLCHTLNACDLSNAAAGLDSVLRLLAYSVSLEHAQCNHPEHNIQVLIAIFRNWALSTLQFRSDLAAGMCTSAAGTSFLELVQVCLASSVSSAVWCAFWMDQSLFIAHLPRLRESCTHVTVSCARDFVACVLLSPSLKLTCSHRP